VFPGNDDEVTMEKQIVYSTDPEDFYYVGVNVPCQAACPAGFWAGSVPGPVKRGVVTESPNWVAR
jgi:hypothetical protein